MRRRTTILCITSAVIGAMFAVLLQEGSDWTSLSPAQTTTQRLPPVTTPPQAVGGTWTPAPEPGSAGLTHEERVNIAVYEATNRSAVNINTQSIQVDSFMRSYVSPGEGSGIVMDRKGHVLTNFHVVEDASEIRVTLHDGKSYMAKPVGADPKSDIAVVRIDAPEESLYPVTLGDSSRLRVGQRVFAIGNPFGLERTLTTGIISSLNRSLTAKADRRKLKALIQIDAAINPGNSGGPLLNSSGQMIGMNTAIASKSGDSAGVGFAIPSAAVARVVPQLIEHGRVIRGDIGIERVYDIGDGLLIAQLTEDGPAEKAGLRGPKVIITEKQRGMVVYPYRAIDLSAADLIIAADGKPTKSRDDLLDVVESKRPGQVVALTIIREEKRMDVDVTLGAD